MRAAGAAVAAVFNRTLAVRPFDRLVQAFDNGLTVEASDTRAAMDYVVQLSHIDGLREGVEQLGASGSPATVAAAVEFILEGLHLNRKLNKDTHDGPARYGR